MENVKKINSRQQVLNHVPQDGGAIIGVRGYLAGVIIAVNYGNIITIGRDPATCNLIMEGDFISRTHCRLSYNNGTGLYTIEDRSTNGIILPGGQITKDDFVLEIGPGIGTMTQYLCEAARQVVAVEIDKMLIPILEDTLSEYDNVEVINQDVLKVDIKSLAEEKNNGKPIKVVANLPYYITTPIIMGLFESGVPIDSITIMVQKEVADRMQTGPGSKDYGALSLAVQYYATAKVILNVSATCFMPRPNVDSAVIKLTRYKEPTVNVADEKLMFKIIRASFNQRRKTLVNGLKNSPELSFSKEQIVKAIEKIGKPETIRGEALTLEEFAELANAFTELK